MDEKTSQSYVASGFNQRLGFGEKCAVLIVDMCRAYYTEGSPLNLGKQDGIAGCQALVELARRDGLPVFWSRVEFEPGGTNGGVFYRKVGALANFDRGNRLGEWLDELAPADGDTILTKQGASSFFGTNLAALLVDQGVDTLLIGGVSTSGCVRATAVDACQHNVVGVVVPEACGDRTSEIHLASLFDMDAKYCDVVCLDEVLANFDA